MQFKKFGKYTIIKKLASGGMADILLACDLSPTGIGRFVVIKRALPKFSENEEFKDMFKNEGKVACNLKHRNITPIYEFGVEKNQFFLSMEYISGRNLRELIKKLHIYKSPISIPNAVHIVKEVASGLNYAHNAIDANTGQPLNLIHRDISPQNIMLSFDGEIKLIDFGIAKISDTNLTRAGHLKGKFSYMSPEQAHGENLDERTDIFCLGIILWEVLTGKRLFASKNELSSLKKIKNCDIPNAQKINPKIPTELNNIVKKALSKNKNSRYKTAAKLEQDLSIFLNKNYPEYSHYDFISLMKTSYKREIMEERESLKTYSSEFKKYINTLNIEESLGTQIDLNIPDISTLVEQPIETQSLPREEDSLVENDESLNDYKSHMSRETINQSETLHPTSQVMEENSTTLIPKKTQDTKEEQSITKTKKGNTQTNPIITQDFPVANNGSLALSLQNDTQTNQPTNYLQRTKSTFGKSTHLYNKKDIIIEVYKKRKKHTKSFFLSFFIIFLVVSFSTVYFGKKYNILDFNTEEKQSRQPTQIKREPLPSSGRVASETGTPSFDHTKSVFKKRKVFIISKPSAAAIFINNQFSSKYTPSLISLEANQISNITLKKEGYLLKNFIFDPNKQKSNSLDMRLTADRKRSVPSDNIQIIQ